MLKSGSRLDADFIRKVSDVIKMLGHTDRIRMVEYIREEERSVNQIRDWCGLSQPVTSQHLRLMKDKGVLSCRREGTKMFYSLPNPLVHKMLDCLATTQEDMMRG
jgi:DNA-binding transcriptional ArsR family regulator